MKLSNTAWGALLSRVARTPFMNILDAGFVRHYRSREYQERVRSERAGCPGCFYGEYREPWYLIHDVNVFLEWTAEYLRRYRRGHPSPDPREPDRLREEPSRVQ